MTKKQLAAILDRPRRLMPFKDALKYGAFGRDKAYELLAANLITAYKDGRKTLLDLDSIDAYRATLPKLVSRRKPRVRK